MAKFSDFASYFSLTSLLNVRGSVSKAVSDLGPILNIVH
jgi:hypothetical protein